MKTVFKDPWVDGLINQGRAEMLLALVETRFGVPAGIRERVAGLQRRRPDQSLVRARY